MGPVVKKRKPSLPNVGKSKHSKSKALRISDSEDDGEDDPLLLKSPKALTRPVEVLGRDTPAQSFIPGDSEDMELPEVKVPKKKKKKKVVDDPEASEKRDYLIGEGISLLEPAQKTPKTKKSRVPKDIPTDTAPKAATNFKSKEFIDDSDEGEFRSRKVSLSI